MHKYVIVTLTILILSSCTFFEDRDLKKMEDAVRQHIKYNDEKNKIHTNVLELKALSYEKVKESDREQANDAYQCKVYLNSKWSELRGNRVYNFTDTLVFYFDENKVLTRRADKK